MEEAGITINIEVIKALFLSVQTSEDFGWVLALCDQEGIRISDQMWSTIGKHVPVVDLAIEAWQERGQIKFAAQFLNGAALGVLTSAEFEKLQV